MLEYNSSIQFTIISAEPAAGASQYLFTKVLNESRKGLNTLLLLNGIVHIRHLFSSLSEDIKLEFTVDRKTNTLVCNKTNGILKIATRDEKVDGILFPSVYMDRVSMSDDELKKIL
jgi:hypothetical protein